MTALKRKFSVKDVVGAIPKMKTTYVRRVKKIRTFPLHSESAVNKTERTELYTTLLSILNDKFIFIPGHILNIPLS